MRSLAKAAQLSILAGPLCALCYDLSIMGLQMTVGRYVVQTLAVFSDMTQLADLANYLFATDRPGAWFHPSGYGTLGYALPAAIGAKVAQPGRPIMALTGDFGLQFTVQELIAAVELGLGLPIVLWNNAAPGQIRDDMLAAGITPVAVTGKNPEFIALALAHAERVTSCEALTGSIRAALGRNLPTLIEAREGDFS